MLTRRFHLVLGLVAIGQVMGAQNPAAGKLVRMVQLKMPEPAVLSAARADGTIGKLSAEELIKLREAGASDSLLLQLTGEAPAPRLAKPVPASATLAPPPLASEYNSDLSALSCDRLAARQKRILAVKRFDFGAMKTTEQAVFETHGMVGQGMTALAVKRIQEAGKFRVVERENVDAVLAEQDFGAGPRVKQGTHAKSGRILGADAILLATVTVFGRDDRQKTVGGIGGVLAGPLAGIKIGSREDKAVVAISYRLVDAESSETIAAGETRGESSRKSKNLSLGALLGPVGGGGGIDMTSSGFAETIIGEATMDCLNKLMAALNAGENSIQRRSVEIESRIAEVAGTKIYIASGAADGVRRCDRFEVSRVIKEIQDPVTKAVLDMQVERVGDLVITEVREKVAIGLFNGSEAPRAGFAVRKQDVAK